MIIASVTIPKMFTAYAHDMGYLDNGLHQYQYFCEECDQAFAAAWGKLPNSMSWYERGKYFHCPYCGTMHGPHVAYIKIGEKAPYKIRLTLKTYKNLVIFELYGDTVMFNDVFKVRGGKYKEVFRFDIAKQAATFSRLENGNEERVEIGNPFELEWLSKSILGFFTPRSLASVSQKRELNHILKSLRESVHGMLEKRLGHKVKSMFVSPGQHYGAFLLPIFNVAYRLGMPDSPNLPVEYREPQKSIKNLWHGHMITDTEWAAEVLRLTRKKMDTTTALITVKNLPNTAAVRRAIAQNIFEVETVRMAFDLCCNYDYAVNLHTAIRKTPANRKELFEFLRNMLPIYGEAGLIQIVELAEVLKDCFELYQQLNEQNRRAILEEKVRIRDLHDWMAKRHRRQSHKNLTFSVPDHIVRRLSMQTNRLKFFLPKESVELIDAGVELHNCVASYGRAMLDNTKWIVLVSDDNGRLAACLEIEGRNLVQAKIDKNRPVAGNPKLNAEVLSWAKEANLKIETADIATGSREEAAAVC